MWRKPEEAAAMAEAGADAVIAHVGTTVGGSIGVTGAVCSMEDAACSAARRYSMLLETINPNIFFSLTAVPSTPEDATQINQMTDAQGFVGASSLERMGVEESLTNLTRTFKQIPVELK